MGGAHEGHPLSFEVQVFQEPTQGSLTLRGTPYAQCWGRAHTSPFSPTRIWRWLWGREEWP